MKPWSRLLVLLGATGCLLPRGAHVSQSSQASAGKRVPDVFQIKYCFFEKPRGLLRGGADGTRMQSSVGLHLG